MNPESLDQLFPIERQRSYVSVLTRRGGLTTRRAEYFVRLWAYLFIKEQRELGRRVTAPVTQLYPPEGLVACTHREAAELFYGNKERGSDRAAGMMIDQLAALGLLEKQFDGQTLSLQIRTLPELNVPVRPTEPPKLEPDSFNPRTDAIPVASLIARNYAWMTKDESVAPQRIAKILRRWAQHPAVNMRVLRRCDNLNPVGCYILYPTTSESEAHFFRPPSKSFYLTSTVEADPFEMAHPGDLDCSSIYVRAWIVDAPYMQRNNVCQFLEDTQATLTKMQVDFPNLCDLYSLVIHPVHEEMRLALGFQRTCLDSQRLLYWVYLAVDRFLELDIQQALSGLQIDPITTETQAE